MPPESPPDELRDQLVAIRMLRHAAEARAAHPPRLGPDAWRGDAYAAYALTADALAGDLATLAADLGRAEHLARVELARALA